MTLVPIKPGMPGARYVDPLYEQLARAAEARHGLPSGILDAIRTRGERSNANQVSEAGARSVYQFIPSTRNAFKRKFGVDAWAGPEQATEAAALHLLEDQRRTGSWDQAITRYHGGPNPRQWGPRTRAYAQRVGSFDGVKAVPQNPYYSGGIDPLAPLMDEQLKPEAPKQTAPIPGDPGPSAAMPATAAVNVKKRGGILGALESVFMPDPGSLWAGALRDGLFNAKESQQAYRQNQAQQTQAAALNDAKLKELMAKSSRGEYQIAGNNIVHIPAGGGEPRIITPPQQPGEKERLIDAWRREQDPAVRELMERMILGSNDSDVIAEKGAITTEVARTRTGGTVESARIRASRPPAARSSAPQLRVPQGWTVVK